MFSRLNPRQLLSLLECDGAATFHKQLAKLSVNESDIHCSFEIMETLTPSLLTPVNEMSTPIDIAWGLTGIVGIGVAGAAISIAFLGVTGLLGAFYCYLAYQKGKKRVDELMEFFQFSYLQLEIMDELNRSNRPRVSSSQENGIEQTTTRRPRSSSMSLIMKSMAATTTANPTIKPDYPVEKTGRHDFVDMVNESYRQNSAVASVPLKNSIGVAMVTSLTLFCSMFLGVNALIYAMGFAALAGVMTGPIGIAVAVGVSLMAGCYLGYQHYQLKKKLQAVNGCKQEVTSHINTKRTTCINNHLEQQLIDDYRLINQQSASKKIDINKSRDFGESTNGREISNEISLKSNQSLSLPLETHRSFVAR
jgi:hypothetical protein